MVHNTATEQQGLLTVKANSHELMLTNYVTLTQFSLGVAVVSNVGQ